MRKPGGVCKDCEAAWMSVAGCTKQKTTGAAAPGYNNELKKSLQIKSQAEICEL